MYTPYVGGMAWFINARHINSAQMTHLKICSRLFKGLYKLYQSFSIAFMSNMTVNVAGEHR